MDVSSVSPHNHKGDWDICPSNIPLVSFLQTRNRGSLLLTLAHLSFHLIIASEVFMQSPVFWSVLLCGLVAVYHCHFPDDSVLCRYCCKNVRSCWELFAVDVLLHWSKEVDVWCWAQGLVYAVNGQDISSKTAPGIALWYRLCGCWHSEEQFMSRQGYFIFKDSFMSFFHEWYGVFLSINTAFTLRV